MASTSYYTVNGRILGQSASGVRTGYIRDHLGSVVATTNSSGTVLNRYSYKPYGGVLTKTGTPADPRFLWCGGYGYRQTDSGYASQYVRARHYAEASGNWVTSDPLYAASQMNSYDYASNNPVSIVDITGLLSHKVTFGPKARDGYLCGAAEIHHKWLLDDGENNGFIVMQINVYCYVKDCYGTPIPAHGVCCGVEYWEAWRVIDRKIYSGTRDDTDSNTQHLFRFTDEAGKENKCKYGLSKVVGKAKFLRMTIEGMLRSGFSYDQRENGKNGRKNCAGPLLVTETKPNWWSNDGTRDLRLAIEYGCCCSEPRECQEAFGDCPPGPCKLPPIVTGH